MGEIGYRIRDVVPSLDYDELLKMMRDLQGGGKHLKRFIASEIKRRKHEHEKYCATCQAPIGEHEPQTYTLVFGPEDFKKKASFCAKDCLMHFIDKLPSGERVDMTQQRR